MRRNIPSYTTSTVDIRHKPVGALYDSWADAIYEARGQIGLLVEEATVLSGVDWDPACEGIVITENFY